MNRKSIDEINSDELDRLYDRLEEYRDSRRRWMEAAYQDRHAAVAASAAVERVRALHQPMGRGPFTVCTHCSGWNGVRCLGVVTPHPCDTLTALDAQPAPDSATAAGP